MNTPDRPRHRRLSTITVVGLVLLLVGLGSLGWVGYQYFGSNAAAQEAFQQGKTQLKDQWTDTTKTNKKTRATGRTIPGTAIALLRIPALGDDYEVPILSGIDPDTLTRGIGHFPKSAQPGEIGNFAVAGHRVTHGQPFARLLELRTGDKIIIETRDAIYTYRLDASPKELTVKNSETWVLDPVPGTQGQPPTKALITLVTCQDLFRSPDRSVGFGQLVQTDNKP